MNTQLDSETADTEPLLRRLMDSTPTRSGMLFRRLWPQIEAALAEGFTIRAVHSELVKGGQWTSGYETFRDLVAKSRDTARLRQPERRDEKARASMGIPESVRRQRAWLERNKNNPLLERRDRVPFDYSGLSEEAKDLIGPAD